MAPARDRPRLHEGTPRLDLHRRMPCAISAGDSFRRSRAGFDPAGRRRRKTAAYLRGIAPRHRRLVVRHLGEHDHSYRHEGAQDRAISARYSRPRSSPDERPFSHRAAREHRQKDHDARFEIEHDPEKWRPVFRKDHAPKLTLRRQTRVRPRASPTTAEIRNRMTAIKKMALAISIDAPAIPPKPRIPAISATTKKVTTQLNMTSPLL